jgi:hypothetical protein
MEALRCLINTSPKSSPKERTSATRNKGNNKFDFLDSLNNDTNDTILHPGESLPFGEHWWGVIFTT